ncbi:protein TolR [Candidatus Endobugula sertula]|uniref:Tol-Pal system protein TolR n=1 Tax=Candidatus Endobugula sertula TaxID=62101 RepID=A0A1D2QLY5_9GAMM|nr:protein TolR [Candidatus Endobugula sertula]
MPFIKHKKKPMAEINVVPYIDVMLVLLIIFMVTAPLLLQGVEVELPEANSSPTTKKGEPLVISVDVQNNYYLNVGENEKEAKPLHQITEQVAKVLKVKPNTPVLVWGDKNVPYGTVVILMSRLQGAGATSVGLVTEPPK